MEYGNIGIYQIPIAYKNKQKCSQNQFKKKKKLINTQKQTKS